MKKIVIVLFSVFFVFSPAYSKSEEKLDLKSQSFMDLGRYVETLEINEASEEEMQQEAFEETQENINDYIFEEEARLDIAKRAPWRPGRPPWCGGCPGGPGSGW